MVPTTDGGLPPAAAATEGLTWGLDTFEDDPEEASLLSDTVEVFGTSPFKLKQKVHWIEDIFLWNRIAFIKAWAL